MPLPDSAIRQFYNRVTEPHPSIIVEEDRRRARLFSAMLLVGALTSFVLVIATLYFIYAEGENFTNFGLASTATIISIALYPLSRTQYYRLAVALLIGLLSTALIIASLIFTNLFDIIYVVLLVGYAAMLFSPRAGIWLTLGVTTIVVIAAPLIPRTALSFDVQFGWMMVAFFTICLNLIILSTMVRGDVNQIRAQAQGLRKAKEEADRANQAKSTFLANMSHELRAPMTAILGFADVLQQSATISSADRDHLEVVQRSGSHLLSLIDDILEVSRIEAGHVTYEPSDIDLYSVVDDALTLLAERAKTKNLQLNWEIFQNVPQYMYTDGRKLRQIMINLVNNAVKYTERGSVDVFVLKTSNTLLEIIVADTGVGIAQDELERIFEAFHQVDSGRKARSGTGLGLTISQEYAAMMRGRLHVESRLNKGSAFHVELPYHPPQGQTPPPAEPPREACHMLLVEVEQPRLEELLKSVTVDVRHTNVALLPQLVSDWVPTVVILAVDNIDDLKKILAPLRAMEASPMLIGLCTDESQHARLRSEGFKHVCSPPTSTLDAARLLSIALPEQYWHRAESVNGPVTEASLLSAEDIVQLRPDVVRALQNSALQADLAGVQGLIAELQSTHPHIADKLDRLAYGFRFDLIIEMIDSFYATHEAQTARN